MIYVHNNSNFFTHLGSVLHTEPNEFNNHLTAINQEYNALKTEMNKEYENYKSKFTQRKMVMKKKNKKKRKGLPLIKSQHEKRATDDSQYYNQRNQISHVTLSPKTKQFINLFKSSIMQNKKSITNYKQCITEIEKEFYITGSNFNPNSDVILRQGIGKQNEKASYDLKKGNENTKDNEDHKNIAFQVHNSIQHKMTKDQLELLKLEELKQKIYIKKDKVNKRIKVLKNAIRYLQGNGIKFNDYINNNPFPPKPFYLPYSTEFINAAKFNKIDIIEEALNRNLQYLLEHDYYGQTAYHWTAKMGYVKLLQLLMKKGKCCNQYDKKHRTPLYLAALNNQIECCLILVNKHGNIDHCDLEGKRPCDVTNDPKLKNQLMEVMHKEK